MPKIDCPHCGKPLAYNSLKDLPHFPFCSERCKMVDLGHWFDENHRISEDLLAEKEPGKSSEDNDPKKTS